MNLSECYTVRLRRIGSIEGISKEMQACAQKIDHLVLGGHGRPKTIFFGEGSSINVPLSTENLDEDQDPVFFPQPWPQSLIRIYFEGALRSRRLSQVYLDLSVSQLEKKWEIAIRGSWRYRKPHTFVKVKLGVETPFLSSNFQLRSNFFDKLRENGTIFVLSCAEHASKSTTLFHTSYSQTLLSFLAQVAVGRTIIGANNILTANYLRTSPCPTDTRCFNNEERSRDSTEIQRIPLEDILSRLATQRTSPDISLITPLTSEVHSFLIPKEQARVHVLSKRHQHLFLSPFKSSFVCEEVEGGGWELTLRSNQKS